MVADCGTDAKGVEEGSRGARKAGSLVPLGTKTVVSTIEGVGIHDAGSSREDVAIVAGQAVTVVAVPGVALITDEVADSVFHKPSLRAGYAGISVPSGTSGVLSSEFAAVVHDSVALIAGKADSLSSIELAAERRSLATDSMFVEVVSLGAFGTLVLDPGFAAVVVGDGDDVVEWDAGGGGVVATEVSGERAECEVSVDGRE